MCVCDGFMSCRMASALRGRGRTPTEDLECKENICTRILSTDQLFVVCESCNVPRIPRYGPRNCRQVILQQVQPDTSHVCVEIFVPVQLVNVKIKQFPVVFVQFLPQLLYVFICKFPVSGTEVGYYIAELVDFLVNLQQS